MAKASFRFYVAGKSQQMKRIVTAFDDVIAPELIAVGILEAEDDMANIPPLQIKIRVTADFGFVSGIIVGLTFFGGWLSKKVLDETIGDAVSETIKKLIEKARFNEKSGENERMEYQQIIVGDLTEPVIAVRVIVETDDTLAEILYAMSVAQTHALQWFEANGRKAGIHCHTINKGQCNIEPELFETL